MKIFRLRLKDLREAKGLSQQQLANVLNVSQGSVGNWESGIREPKFDLMNKIADYFEVSVDYLLGKSEFPEHEAHETAQAIAGGIDYDNLFKIIKEKNISLKKLSSKTAISLEQLYDWKFYKSGPSVNQLWVLSKYLNVSMEYLVGKTDFSKSQNETICKNVAERLSISNGFVIIDGIKVEVPLDIQYDMSKKRIEFTDKSLSAYAQMLDVTPETLLRPTEKSNIIPIKPEDNEELKLASKTKLSIKAKTDDEIKHT